MLGSGPIRIGQGVEFDYSTVHAIWSIREAGYEAIIINNNPETVSTDYTTSDKLYFEPLMVEDVMNVIHLEKPKAIVVSLGGQTAINLAEPLAQLGVPIIGTDVRRRSRTPKTATALKRSWKSCASRSPRARPSPTSRPACKAAARIGYPVLVRPSYVLGGRAMQIVSQRGGACATTCRRAVEVNEDPAGAGRPLHHRARSWRWTPSATARTSSSPASWSMWSARASTRATRSASIRPSASARRPRTRSSTIRSNSGLRHRHRGPLSTSSSSSTKTTRSMSSRSTRVRRVPCRSSPRRRACPWRDIATQVILGKTLARAGHHRSLRHGEETLVRQGPGLLVLQDPRHGRLPVARDEVHRRGHRLRRQPHPRALQGVAGLGHERRQLRHDLRHHRRRTTRSEALPLVRRFYDLGFNIEATRGHGRVPAQATASAPASRRKLSEGSEEIIDSLRQGHVSYVINTSDVSQHEHATRRLRDPPLRPSRTT